jgi:protein-tyrosine phosphatase
MEITTILDGKLYVSGEITDWEPLSKLRIDSIVDMDGGIDPGIPEVSNHILYVYYPIADAMLPCSDKLHAVGSMIAGLVRTEHRVLVHCLMGYNRSCLVIGTALTHLGMSGEQALTHLQERREGALFNQVFAEYLKGLQRRG